MGGSRRPDGNQGRYRQMPPPHGGDARARGSAQRGARSAGARNSRARGPFARMRAAWRRFRARPDAPQIIAGTLLALALVCGALGVLMHPNIAQGSYTLPQTSSGGRAGTAAAASGTPDGTPGSILAPTATPPSAPTATTAPPTATPQPTNTPTATPNTGAIPTNAPSP